jgi:hypothetical protein
VSYAAPSPFPLAAYGQTAPEASSPPPIGDSGSKWPVYLLVGGVVIGVGYLVWRGFEGRQRRLDTIAKREGSSGVLKYQAGEALIGLGSMAGARALSRRNRGRRRGKKRTR